MVWTKIACLDCVPPSEILKVSLREVTRRTRHRTFEEHSALDGLWLCRYSWFVNSRCKFLLSRRLLCGPDKCLMRSCKLTKFDDEQKQHENVLSGAAITPRCTEQRCFSKWAFCLNMATQSLHAKGFSPVCTLRWVFKFHDMPNCLPQ